jgi:RNA polymerase sigma factor (sigma-70 family)
MAEQKVVILKGRKAVSVTASVKNAHQHDRDKDRERKRRKRCEAQGIEIPEFVSLEAMREETRQEPVSDTNVEETVSQLMLCESVRRAVAELPEKKRKVIELRFFENMTVRDTANALGIPRTTAESREKAALADLKKVLQKFI